jgi:hypothetical protein
MLNNKINKITSFFDKESMKTVITDETMITISEALELTNDCIFEVNIKELKPFLSNIDNFKKQFNRDFVSGLALRTALKDFLDEESIDIDDGVTIEELAERFPFPAYISVRSKNKGFSHLIRLQKFGGIGRGRYQVSCRTNSVDNSLYSGSCKLATLWKCRKEEGQ